MGVNLIHRTKETDDLANGLQQKLAGSLNARRDTTSASKVRGDSKRPSSAVPFPERCSPAASLYFMEKYLTRFRRIHLRREE